MKIWIDALNYFANFNLLQQITLSLIYGSNVDVSRVNSLCGKLYSKGKMEFHMIEKSLDEEDILQNPEKYQFISIKIPFRVVEGKQ